jgi:hypothetical protein
MIVVSHNDFMHHMVDFGERHTVSFLRLLSLHELIGYRNGIIVKFGNSQCSTE